MTSEENRAALRLRPHHIVCDRFLPLEMLIRGEEFAATIKKINELTQADSEAVITVTEGPDQVCQSCPVYSNGRCESPMGNEESVRKWDGKIVKALGLSYGQTITVREVLALIREKAPLEFCHTRCPWKTVCGIFTANL